MSAASRYGALCRAELRLEYLHANSTTHDFLFGAIAELIDNSRDANARRLDIFTGGEQLHRSTAQSRVTTGSLTSILYTGEPMLIGTHSVRKVNNENFQGGFMLCFLDNGCGMNPQEATDLVYFGRSSKRNVAKMIGHYGNGLKSGSMRIGKDFILFTKKGETMTCLLFSQSFCEKEGLYEVIVPIPSWSTSTRDPLTDDPAKFATQLSIICKHSPFMSEAALMDQFALISGESGTLIIIYNLKLTLSGEPELDNQTDEADILIAESPENFPEQRSLRAYVAILYFDPRMKIFIQAQKVETKRLPYCFYRPRMYAYSSSSFKEVATKELRKAQMDMKAAEDSVKEAKNRLKHLQDTILHANTEFAQEALQAALEKEKRMRDHLEEKKRNLKQPKKLYLIFGINILNRSQDGMLIYSNSRLIRMFEKVGPQKKIDSYCGAGAVGMVDVPLDVMEPTHNKQAFANVKEYNHLLKSMGLHLVQYWKDVGISKKGENFFWSDFGYLSSRWNEKPSDTIQYRRRRAVEIPDIVQCDNCLKWRLLSYDTNINKEGHHDAWNCEMHPNRFENKCYVPEHLPSIPVGVFKSLSETLNDNQKLLIDSIQQRKREMENLQSQRVQLIQPHRIVPHTSDCRTPARKESKPAEKTVRPRRALCEDPSPTCRRWFKSGTNKGPKQYSSLKDQPPPKKRGRPSKKPLPCEEEVYSLSVLEDGDDDSLSEVLTYKMKDERPYNDKNKVIKIEADRAPEVLSVIIIDSDSDDLPEPCECEDNAFPPKEQEPFDGSGDNLVDCVHFEEQILSPTDLESSFAEASLEDSKEHVSVAMQDSRTVVSYAQEASQIISDRKMVEVLSTHIQEILLNYLPPCNLSRDDIICMSPEDILTMFKLKEPAKQHKTETLDINQYYSQYEEHLLGKLQYIEQQVVRAALATETKIGQCETQIKATARKLESLRGKIAQLLFNQNPQLHINNLEDVDIYVEQCLQHEDNFGISHMDIDGTEFSTSVLLDEENGTFFSSM